MTMKNHRPHGSGMTLARFAELAGAYGADFDRWPEPERFAALSLAGGSQEARALLADAHEVDSALARLVPPPLPSAALRDRIAALAPAEARRPGMASSIGRGAGFAMAAAAGLCLGILLAMPGTVGDAGLGLVEASLIAGESPAIAVGELLELD